MKSDIIVPFPEPSQPVESQDEARHSHASRSKVFGNNHLHDVSGQVQEYHRLPSGQVHFDSPGPLHPASQPASQPLARTKPPHVSTTHRSGRQLTVAEVVNQLVLQPQQQQELAAASPTSDSSSPSTLGSSNGINFGTTNLFPSSDINQPSVVTTDHSSSNRTTTTNGAHPTQIVPGPSVQAVIFSHDQAQTHVPASFSPPSASHALAQAVGSTIGHSFPPFRGDIRSDGGYSEDDATDDEEPCTAEQLDSIRQAAKEQRRTIRRRCIYIPDRDFVMLRNDDGTFTPYMVFGEDYQLHIRISTAKNKIPSMSALRQQDEAHMAMQACSNVLKVMTDNPASTHSSWNALTFANGTAYPYPAFDGNTPPTTIAKLLHRLTTPYAPSSSRVTVYADPGLLPPHQSEALCAAVYAGNVDVAHPNNKSAAAAPAPSNPVPDVGGEGAQPKWEFDHLVKLQGNANST